MKKRIREKAVEKELITPDKAAGLPPEECWPLDHAAGILDRRWLATEISGRGVGMDVVKNTIEELGGEIQIQTEPGAGAVFTYKIPELSAVNITDALIIRAGQEYYAVPIGNVVATQAFSTKEIHTALATSECIIYLGSIVPLHDLRRTSFRTGFRGISRCYSGDHHRGPRTAGWP